MKKTPNEQVEKLLKKLAKQAKPDKQFMLSLEDKLKAKFEDLYEQKERKTDFFGFFRFKLGFAMALCLMIVTSTTLYAYNSESVSAGHILYPLKRGTEKIEALLATTPKERYEYEEKMRRRRLLELNYARTNQSPESRLLDIGEEVTKTLNRETEYFRQLSQEERQIIHENIRRNKEVIEERVRKTTTTPARTYNREEPTTDDVFTESQDLEEPEPNTEPTNTELTTDEERRRRELQKQSSDITTEIENTKLIRQMRFLSAEISRRSLRRSTENLNLNDIAEPTLRDEIKITEERSSGNSTPEISRPETSSASPTVQRIDPVITNTEHVAPEDVAPQDVAPQHTLPENDTEIDREDPVTVEIEQPLR